MTRFTKDMHGYHVSGKTYDMLIGTRAQVWHRTAYKTSGDLTRSDLLQNKNGRIVSKVKHASAKREKRLVKAGYGTKKGTFGFVRIGSKGRKTKGRGKSRGRRGGSGLMPLSPHTISGIRGTSGVDVQLMATNY